MYCILLPILLPTPMYLTHNDIWHLTLLAVVEDKLTQSNIINLAQSGILILDYFSSLSVCGVRFIRLVIWFSQFFFQRSDLFINSFSSLLAIVFIIAVRLFRLRWSAAVGAVVRVSRIWWSAIFPFSSNPCPHLSLILLVWLLLPEVCVHSFVVPIESLLVVNTLAKSVGVPSFVAPFQMVRGRRSWSRNLRWLYPPWWWPFTPGAWHVGRSRLGLTWSDWGLGALAHLCPPSRTLAPVVFCTRTLRLFIAESCGR